MKRAKAAELNKATKQIVQESKNRYTFITDEYIKRIENETFTFDDVISLSQVLQEDILKLPNKLIVIRDVNNGTPFQWAVNDIAICNLDNRLVLLRQAPSDDSNKELIFLYKHPNGERISDRLKVFLPTNAKVVSHLINDNPANNNLASLNNIEILAKVKPMDFENYNGFTKPSQVPAFKEVLLNSLESLSFTSNVWKMLQVCKRNEKFKAELEIIISKAIPFIEINKYAKEYNQILEEEGNAFVNEGRPMNQDKINYAKQKLHSETEKYKYNEQVSKDQKSEENFTSALDKYPDEAKSFKEIADRIMHTKSSQVDKILQDISSELNIPLQNLKIFIENYAEVTHKEEKPKPSAPNTKFKLASKTYGKDISELSLDQILQELKEKNNITDKEIAHIHIMYTELMKNYSANWKNKSVQDIYNWTINIRRRKLENWETLDAICACIRALQLIKGFMLRDVQIIAILMLTLTSGGNFAEIATGEGKTIIIAVLVVYQVLLRKQVDVVTSNDVLADDNIEEVRHFYDVFNITYAANKLDPQYKNGPRYCYDCDVVYGTVGNFQFDYLRDWFEGNDTRGNRGFDFLILDEVDCLIIDNGAYIAKLAQSFPGIDYIKYVFIKIWLELQNAESYLQEVLDHELSQIANSKLPDDEKQTTYEYSFKFHVTNSFKTMHSRIKNNVDLRKIPIPPHLHAYCEYMMDKWIENALFAKNGCFEDEGYIVVEVEGEKQIMPVDNANTGVTLQSTIFSNGLHQFLQLKHNVQLKSESLTASFISNLGYIHFYNNQMYGMSGTLGSKSEQEFLNKNYTLNYMRIPTYKPKQFLELDTIVVKDDMWAMSLAMEAYLMVKELRSVLIICNSIADVRIIKSELDGLKSLEDADFMTIRSYETEAQANIINTKLKTCEVIIATNIAGRGTNFSTEKALEEAGGLHVCVAFLPYNVRVQLQAYGRTSRKGNKGTARLICRESDVMATGYQLSEQSTMESILQHRDNVEEARLTKTQNTKIQEVNYNDLLFKKFADTYRSFHKKHKQSWGGIYLCMDLKECWALWLRTQEFKNTEDVDIIYEDFCNKAKPILDGKVSTNPYYALKQAESHISNDDYDKAREALKTAEELSNGNQTNYALYMKLFELEILNGKAVIRRLKEILKSFIFMKTSKKREYKEAALKALDKACDHYKVEIEYIRMEILENKDIFEKVIIPTKMDTEGTIFKQNVFLKHIHAKYQALQIFYGHAETLIEELKKMTDCTFGGKMDNYLLKWKPENPEEQNLRKQLTTEVLNELSDRSTATIYSLKQIYNPTSFEIGVAKGLILSGIGIFIVACCFPFALPVAVPIVGALIGEGVTDLLLMLISGGEADFDMKSYITSKCVSILVSLLTIGFSLVAKIEKIALHATRALFGLAKVLRKCKILSSLLTKLGKLVNKRLFRIVLTKMNAGKALTRSMAVRIGLQHIGVAVGVNLIGTVISDQIVSRALLTILENSRGQILQNVTALVNEKFCTNLEHVSMEKLRTLLINLSTGSLGSLPWDILKETVVSLTQAARSWKIKLVGISLYLVGNGTAIGVYSRNYCNEVIKYMKSEDNVNNSQDVQKQMRDLIAQSVANDVYTRLVALANRITNVFVINPLMSRLITKTMNKYDKKNADNEVEKSFKDMTEAYRTLGLDEGSTITEIKKAYKQLALKYHPDMKSGQSVDLFIKINHAYELLTKIHANIPIPPPTPPKALPMPADLPPTHRGNIETLAYKRGLHIVITDDTTNKQYHFGTDFPNAPVEIKYSPPKNGKIGHYYPPGQKSSMVPTAKNNCFYDSMAYQLAKLNLQTANAMTLRVEATSASFANLKLESIAKGSMIFNNKLTKSIYEKIQANLLVGGMPIRPLTGNTYPSGLIKITTSDEITKELVPLANKIHEISQEALAVNGHLGQNGRNIIITPVPGMNQNSIPVMSHIPKPSARRKTNVMIGGMIVEFDGDKQILKQLIGNESTIKLLSISGNFPFSDALVPDANGKYSYGGQNYTLKPMEYKSNDFKWINTEHISMTEVYDLYNNAHVQLPKEERSTCVAIKLMTEIVNVAKEYKARTGHNLLIKGDIKMVEAYVETNLPKWQNINDVVIEDSCKTCQRLLPDFLGRV